MPSAKPNFIPLEETLSQDRDPQQDFAFCQQTSLSWSQWLLRVEAWYAHLLEFDKQNWAVFYSDSAEFSAILFALWSQGKTSCIIGTNNPATVEDLNQHVDGFIGEFDGVLTQPLISPKDVISSDSHQQSFPILNTELPLIEIFTSGSSGKPIAIHKSINQLSQELSSLEQLWGQQLADSNIVATVSHQHIYGLLFRVLWPICAQRRFHRFNFEFIEDLANQLHTIQNFALISSPTHLSRLPEGLERKEIQQQVSAIFSSGAPLPETASQTAHDFFQQNINEVFGSSETGGIAWRQQHTDAYKHWQPLPNVQFRIDQTSGCLTIQSPHLADSQLDDEQWYETSDLAKSINASSFQLLGRNDKIVKVEGKRLSITAMENRLLAEDGISEARILTLDHTVSDKYKRLEIGAALVLNEQGEQQLARIGRRAFSLLLKEKLLQQFERPLLPRKWRFVSGFKRNSQSKVLHQDLISLFMQDIPAVIHPVITQQTNTDDNKVIFELVVPKELSYFDGHFEQQAILPGVVQVHWAEYMARKCFEFPTNFTGLSNIKFQQIILPGQDVTLELSLIEKEIADQGKSFAINFAYSSSAGKHASGKLAFA